MLLALLIGVPVEEALGPQGAFYWEPLAVAALAVIIIGTILDKALFADKNDEPVVGRVKPAMAGIDARFVKTDGMIVVPPPPRR